MNTELLKALVAATAANSFMYTSAADHGPLVQAGFAQVNAAMVNPNGDGSIATRSTPEGAAYLEMLANPNQTQQPAANFGATNEELAARAAAAQAGQSAPSPSTFQPGHGIGQQSNPEFKRVSGFVPAPKQAKPRNPASGENEKYPFSKLNAPVVQADGTKSYDAVFIPSTVYPKDDKQGRAGQLRSGDDMAFSLQSACNAASRRFATVLKTETKTDANGKTKNVNTYQYERKFAVQGGVGQNGEPGAYIYREQ